MIYIINHDQGNEPKQSTENQPETMPGLSRISPISAIAAVCPDESFIFATPDSIRTLVNHRYGQPDGRKFVEPVTRTGLDPNATSVAKVLRTGSNSSVARFDLKHLD